MGKTRLDEHEKWAASQREEFLLKEAALKERVSKVEEYAKITVEQYKEIKSGIVGLHKKIDEFSPIISAHEQRLKNTDWIVDKFWLFGAGVILSLIGVAAAFLIK